MTAATVLASGPGASLQDLGRPGHSDVGLGRAGAADAESAALANRMLGNTPDAAVIETVLGMIELRFDHAALVAVTGADCPVHVRRQDGSRRGAAAHEVIALEAGDVLAAGRAAHGLRAYVAVRGGFAPARVLGSRSWDSLAALGPRPLAPGRVLPVGSSAETWPLVDAVPPAPLPGHGAPSVLDVIPGPRDDWFDPAWRSVLTGQEYRASEDSDRIGVRVTAGAPLPRATDLELVSEGVELGSVQAPPDGFPVLFLADHPVTGGYPVVAVLTPHATSLAAQLRPGDAFRFRITDG